MYIYQGLRDVFLTNFKSVSRQAVLDTHNVRSYQIVNNKGSIGVIDEAWTNLRNTLC